MKVRVETTVSQVVMPNLLQLIAEQVKHIESLHAELETLIQEYLQTQQAHVVPETAIANIFWGQVAKLQMGRCLCKGVKYIHEKET